MDHWHIIRIDRLIGHAKKRKFETLLDHPPQGMDMGGSVIPAAPQNGDYTESLRFQVRLVSLGASEVSTSITRFTTVAELPS